MKQNYVISVDWLQVFCTGHRSPAEIPSGDFDGKPFWLRLRSYGSSLWCQIADIVWNDWEVAEICWCPRSSAIRSDAFSVRLTNRVLYSQKWLSLLAEIIGHYELTYQGICAFFRRKHSQSATQGAPNVQRISHQYFQYQPISRISSLFGGRNL